VAEEEEEEEEEEQEEEEEELCFHCTIPQVLSNPAI
jgi:hypothetical protein